MLEQELDRKIIISGVVTDDLAREVIDMILAINDFDTKMSVVSTYEPEPIEMFINSVGGSASAGFAIVSAMEMSGTPIVTYGMGMVASVALAIYVSGDIRIATRYVRFMYHTVAYGIEGFIQDHEDALKESEVINKMYNTIIKERTNISEEYMKEIKQGKKDFYFSGVKAVKLGVADEVTPKKEYQSLQFSLNTNQDEQVQ